MLQRLRQRLHDARLAVERWLLVTVFRYQPDLADALIALEQSRRNHAALVRASEDNLRKLRQHHEELVAANRRLVGECARKRAERERLVAEEQRLGPSRLRTDRIGLLQAQEDQLFEAIRSGRALEEKLVGTHRQMQEIARDLAAPSVVVLH